MKMKTGAQYVHVKIAAFPVRCRFLKLAGSSLSSALVFPQCFAEGTLVRRFKPAGLEGQNSFAVATTRKGRRFTTIDRKQC